jgi:hypothetical protein
VRFLRVLRLRLVDTRRVGQGGSAVQLADDTADLVDGIRAQAHRVRTHVGNEAHRALAEVDTFIQALRETHRALRTEAQLARGLLLQRRRRERRRGVALALLLLDVRDDQGALRVALELLLCRLRSAHVRDGELFYLLATELRQLGREIRAVLRRLRVDGPVFAWLEGEDLFLALADHAQCRALHAARRRA